MSPTLPALQFTPRDRCWLRATRAAWYGEPPDPPADAALARTYWLAYLAAGLIREQHDTPKEDAS